MNVNYFNFNRKEVALLKKINAVIAGIILMVSLGLILNVLFSDRASRSMTDQRNFDISREEDAPNGSLSEREYQDIEDEAEGDSDSNNDNGDQSTDMGDQEDGSELSDIAPSDHESAGTDEHLNSSQPTDEDNQSTENDINQEREFQSDQHQVNGRSDTSNLNQSDQARVDNPPASDQQSQVNEENKESRADTNDDTVDRSQDSQSELIAITIDARQDGGDQYLGETDYQVGDTALDILLRFTQDRGISVTLANDRSKGDIYEIDGHQSGENQGQWVLYINGQRTVHQAGANKIAPGSNLRYYYQIQ